MDYYEELGLDRTATEDEIRRAHRRLTKLLHPDQQTDEAVKQLAETQMRRLNAIVETLSDPQHRQEYDDELRRGLPGFQGGKFRRRAFHSWPWWVGSTIGAIVLTVGAVWFSADKWGSSFGDHTPTYIPSGAETSAEPLANGTAAQAPPSAAPATTPGPGTPAQQETAKAQSSTPQAPPTTPQSDNAAANPTPSRTVASVPAPGPANKAQPPGSQPTVVVAEIPHRKILSLPLTHVSAAPRAASVNLPAAPALSTAGVGHVETVSLPSGNLPSAPTPPEPAAAAATISKDSSPAKARDAVEGEWVYAPTEPEKRKAGFFPPEYIDLKIWNEGGLHGQYRARYHIVDKPIPPDVNFALTADGSPRRFTWESNNGSKGTLRISSIDAGSIRIEWRTTVFSHGLALTAGTATLVRRTP